MNSKRGEVGDHIYVEYLLYTHHGVYIGDGKVIHKSKENGAVTETTLTEFADGRTIYILQAAACDPPEVIVQRAQSQLGKSGYNLFFDNCEHFATWCQTGSPKSPQVRKWVAKGVWSGVSAGASAFVKRSASSAAMSALTAAGKKGATVSLLSLVAAPATGGLSLLGVFGAALGIGFGAGVVSGLLND